LSRKSIAAAAAVAVVLAAPAFAASAPRLTVERINETTFEVRFRAGAFEQDFWCTAGDYAARRLGARNTTRIYRISEPPRRAGQGVRFSLDPAGRASSSGLNRVGNDDASLSVGSAQNQCEVARLMRERR
jgi:opacity protein-like surface antigen